MPRRGPKPKCLCGKCHACYMRMWRDNKRVVFNDRKTPWDNFLFELATLSKYSNGKRTQIPVID